MRRPWRRPRKGCILVVGPSCSKRLLEEAAALLVLGFLLLRVMQINSCSNANSRQESTLASTVVNVGSPSSSFLLPRRDSFGNEEDRVQEVAKKAAIQVTNY